MIFTIGYSAQKKPRLPALKLDELAHIREQLGAVIVDVRARPYSRWRPEMNNPALEKRFSARYVSMAATLGNKTRSLPGKVDSDGIAFLLEHERGHEGGKPLLLMCTEKPPGDCHRHHAIAMALPVDSVLHLYHDGEEWTVCEAHELQAAMDEDRDYRCLGLGDPFNADFLRSAGILPWEGVEGWAP
jgi:hypothetical protein